MDGGPARGTHPAAEATVLTITQSPVAAETRGGTHPLHLHRIYVALYTIALVTLSTHGRYL